MLNSAADRIEAALRLLSMEAEDENGSPLSYTYTLAEDLYRIQSAVGGGPFSAIGDKIKDASVEMRLALSELREGAEALADANAIIDDLTHRLINALDERDAAWERRAIPNTPCGEA